MTNLAIRLSALISISIFLPTTSSVATAAEQPAVVRFAASVNVGRDVGQSLGSIFEVKNSAGQVIAGAGFAETYNTRFRGGRHVLQFYVRPSAQRDAFSVKRLPHPGLGTGIYLHDLDRELYAWSSSDRFPVRHWDRGQAKWLKEMPPTTKTLRSGEQVMRLGSKYLTMTNNRVLYDGQTILAPPKLGRYYNFYYALGHLYFYHTVKTQAEKFTKIYACPWTTEKAGLIDLRTSQVITAKYLGAVPFAWGQLRHEALTVSNYGGVYVFNGKSWRVILEGDDKVSYQVYSMVNYYDRLFLAQYPTGNLFEYDGRRLRHLKDWPPRLPGVSKYAREAQTMMLYRGDLLVGVWPWAELWRLETNSRKWKSMGRVFTHPPLSDKKVHPYEADADKLRLVTNHWGQRITGMVPLSGSLFLATSSKGTDRWLDHYDFLTDAKRREYGAVLELKMGGNLAAPISWTPQDTKIECIVGKDELILRQDGRELGRTKMSNVPRTELRSAKVTWGNGVFGPFRGRLRALKD